ncbi:hypothetical protein I4641_20535 [Waterburya agarophytonicola K14]|uniref:Uncharacterized protein n=1 Tax=Waterburya agarophytonicola KI4 TaxID=2874699 RepID=A0A964FHT9_9CYAN|nr:hypothetical protein [Waterburya agarophytonicola]MCC0179352.1 hypothetical protein [Waterburya agarophytonicola KI4]
MTLTTNSLDYAQLLAKYQPKVIETEAENDRAIASATELEHRANRALSRDGCKILQDGLKIIAISSFQVFQAED